MAAEGEAVAAGIAAAEAVEGADAAAVEAGTAAVGAAAGSAAKDAADALSGAACTAVCTVICSTLLGSRCAGKRPVGGWFPPSWLAGLAPRAGAKADPLLSPKGASACLCVSRRAVTVGGTRRATGMAAGRREDRRR